MHDSELADEKSVGASWEEISGISDVDELENDVIGQGVFDNCMQSRRIFLKDAHEFMHKSSVNMH